MNVGQMLSKHLIAAVLLIIVIALGTGIFFITKEKPEAELLPTQLSVTMSVPTEGWHTLTATLASNGAPLEGKVIEWSENFPPDFPFRPDLPSLATDSLGQVSVTFPATYQVLSYWPWPDNAFRITASFAGANQYRESSESVNMLPSESLIDKVWGIADSYGSGVGYEINSWTDNEAWASIYLEAENEPIPFENFYFQMTDNDWSMKSRSRWSVPSPSKALTVTDYSIHTTMVAQDIQTFSCLDFIFPQVRNSSNWPAFVGSVELKLENPSDRYWRSYSTVGHSIEGIVSPWGTAWVSHGGGPIWINWYRNGHDNLLPATILRMDHLEGKTFEITITLKDGAETVLAENTFTHTF
ncbi:hypothetical protein ES703_10051 [subsurface metagenome]